MKYVLFMRGCYYIFYVVLFTALMLTYNFLAAAFKDPGIIT